MNTLKTLLFTLALVLLSACSTSPNFQTGNYKLVSLSQSGAPVDKLVMMNLSKTDLIISSVEHMWGATIDNNSVGEFYPINRPKSLQVGAFEGMFLNTLRGAVIENDPNGILVFRQNDRIVALFEPVRPAQTAPALGQ